MSSSETVIEESICRTGGGVFLPASYEFAWPDELRTFLYFGFLLYCFLGIMVASDIFMGAIERVTSKRVRKLNRETNRYMTVLVWNPTVANLSLMALGSSAPEILLSVIEVTKNNFYSGKLGPSTIVGSAAFNLFCIIAVCIVAIPSGEVRKIKETQVYFVTASFSLFAYFWLIMILVVISPNVLELWESLITLLLFPALLVAAYMADRGMIPGTKPVEFGRQQVIGMSKEELAERQGQLQAEHAGTLTEEQVTKMLMIESQQTSYAARRVAVMRKIIGGKPVTVSETIRASVSRKSKVMPIMDTEDTIATESKAVIEFKVMKLAVMESASSVNVTVTRMGALNQTVTVDYETVDGTAKRDADYVYMMGTLTFPPNVTEQSFSVRIIDDVAYEEDEEFYVNISNPRMKMVDDTTYRAEIGIIKKVTIVIIDDDLPGVIRFPEDQVHVQEQAKDFSQRFVVSRQSGSTGKVTCEYSTEDASALGGLDFEPVKGVLTFENAETQREIEVVIKARGRYDKTEIFRIILKDPTGGAKLDKETDGGDDSCILTVMIETNQEAKKQLDRIMSNLQSNWEKSKVGHANWAEQFKNALYVQGGEEDEDEAGNKVPAGIGDWAMHIVTFPWKMLFALVPPTDYCGGWAAFVGSLCMIGLVTAMVGDVAALFGCVCGLPDEVTAISIVALGTSLPDTFASKAAAVQDPYADASVGNVTGSNSVNVFLGLGLPWVLGSLKWTISGPDETWLARYADDFGVDVDMKWKDKGVFIVKAGSLSYSVIVFTVCALICMALLAARRKVYGGELGGPTVPKYLSAAFLVVLWIIYIALSAWNCVQQLAA